MCDSVLFYKQTAHVAKHCSVNDIVSIRLLFQQLCQADSFSISKKQRRALGHIFIT